jgi:hypothetical protein
VPVAALRHAQPDDLFWAARRVAAFSDEMIRAIVKTGGYTDPAAERHLADVLIQRRDKIAAAYLVAVNPLVNFALSTDGELTFDNAASASGGAQASREYHVTWSGFDNTTSALTPIGESTVASGASARAPGPLPSSPGTFVCVRVTAVEPPYETWKPVRAYFRRGPGGWTLVGIERSSPA